MTLAVIFDMDGLLIDSEPLWEQAEIATFTRLGVPLTSSMCRETRGLRIDEVVKYWFARYPWDSNGTDQVEAEIIQKLIDLIRAEGTAKPGVKEVVQVCQSMKLPMSIASSSHAAVISAVVEKLNIGNYIQIAYSAEHEQYGKPHPGVYLTTAQKLGVEPLNCVAIEDSLNGVLAAKAARMKCIAIPESDVRDDKRFCIADAVLSSLLDVTQDTLESLRMFK